VNADIVRAVEGWARELDGVFTLSDLRVLLGDRTEAALYKRLNALVAANVLVKVMRGLYAVPAASLKVISSRIEPLAYISTGTVLADCAAIGSVPVRRVQAVKLGSPRTYECTLGVIEHLSISAHLYFGFRQDGDMRVATPEKAFLDVCYYTYRGRAFSFDPAADISLDGFRMDLIDEYLRSYDARFVTFFNRVWRSE